MKFWKYGRVALALIGAIVLGMSITCCGVYTSGYMYVTGAQYNQIGAYKIDHDFGYLTRVSGSPFSSAGNNPVQEVVIPGGRFLAVVNKGSSAVSIFTIGGAGALYFQHSYPTSGSNPVSITIAPSGNFLYVVDQLAPDGSGRGDITVFQIDPSTGKLTLITNANTFNTSGSQLPYFEVNYKPVQVVTAGSFLYVLDQAYEPSGTGVPPACVNAPLASPCTTPDVFLYAINPTNGQLTLTQNAPLTIAAQPGWLTTIAVSASGRYVYIADTVGGSSQSLILPFTVNATSGVLQTLVGGPVPNNPGSTYPDAIITNSNSNFLYVANFGPGSVNQPSSNISAFTIDTNNGQLQPIALGNYPTGSGPIWMAQDPTNQYLYTANFNDNTITGKVIGQTNGQLSNLLKGSVQTPTVGQPTFVAVSGRTY
jgi:6-phosphogluconolactonase (cycloisomerase 2 family)